MSDNYRRDSFSRSCPQTEMERMKAHYLKEKSSYSSHDSSQSSIDVSGICNLHQYSQQQHQQLGHWNHDTSSTSSMDSSCTDMSLDKLSPFGNLSPASSARTILPPRGRGAFSDAPSGPGLQHSRRGGGYPPGSFAQSCPQTTMERMKAQYLKEKPSYFSHNSSQKSSVDGGGLQQHQQHQQYRQFQQMQNQDRPHQQFQQTQNQDRPHQQFQQTQNQDRPRQQFQQTQNQDWQHQQFQQTQNQDWQYQQLQQYQNSQHQQQLQSQHHHIRSYNSDEDDDVLSLNFNSPVPDLSSCNMPPPPNQRATSNHAFASLPPPVPRGDLSDGSYHPDAFARSCPQTEMERLMAHYTKSKTSSMLSDGSSGSSMPQPTQRFSIHNSFASSPSLTDNHSSGQQGHGNNPSLRRYNSAKMLTPDRFHNDHSLDSWKYSPQQPKEKSKSVNGIGGHIKELCGDLGVFSVNVNGAFSDEVPRARREAVFDCIRKCKAQIILMNNTGLGTEEQLQEVRAQVKVFFPCESAMWASFPASTDEASAGVPAGRGVAIVVLGPLAPRTGWIKSDSAGCVISASARIKPNLPVLTFIACDYGGVIPDAQTVHPSMCFLSQLATEEFGKDNIVIVGGNLRGDFVSQSSDSLCGLVQFRGIDYSVVCDSNVPLSCGSFPEDMVMCQKKRVMTITSVEVSKSMGANSEVSLISPCLVKLNIAGWPKKSFAMQLKSKHVQVQDMTDDKCSNLQKPDESFHCTRQSLLEWKRQLQDYNHNLQGILHANILSSVQCNCLKQLLTDVMAGANANPALIDAPGFATTRHLKEFSALLTLSDADFIIKSPSVIKRVVGSWSEAVSHSIAEVVGPP